MILLLQLKPCQNNVLCQTNGVNNIPRKDSNLKISPRVCSHHIEEDEVLKGRWLEGNDGKQIFYTWNNWILKDGAIPRIFPGI